MEDRHVTLTARSAVNATWRGATNPVKNLANPAKMIQGVMSALGKRGSMLSQRRALHSTRALQKAGDWMDGPLHQDTELVQPPRFLF